MWTRQQLDQYLEKGFLIERGVLSSQEVDQLLTATDTLISNSEAQDPQVHIIKEKSGAVRSIFCAHRNMRPYVSLCQSQAVGGPVKQVFNEDAYIFHSKLNYKDAFEGSVWLWHQDYGYWQYDGVSDKMMSVLIMLDDTTLYNGCILMIAGSHRWGILDHYSDETTTSYKQWCITPDHLTKHITSEGMFVPITGKPGDVCFFDCKIVHGSGHNLSPRPRCSLIYAYAALSNQPHGVDQPRPDWVVARQFDNMTQQLEATAV